MPYYSKEQINHAKEMDLFTYLKNYEPNELVKESRTQYCTKTHDSLKISNGYWNWCSKGIGGKNAVDFLEKVRGYKFIKAVEIILNKENIQTPVYQRIQERDKLQQIILPEKNSNNNKAISYLKARKIDEEIIKNCIENKLIYEDKFYHNVIFLGYDFDGNIKYGGRRATNNTNFKSDITGSNKGYSFKLESNKKTDTIYIFEGAIDLLSYATLLKKYDYNWQEKTMISLAGVYQPARIIEESKVPKTLQNYLEKHKEIRKIVLCLDNDPAGRNATKALQIVLSKKYEIVDKPPKKCKDYNEYLCEILNKKSKQFYRKNNEEIDR